MPGYSVNAIVPHVIEIEPEVRDWLDSLPDHDYGRVEFYADLLAGEAETLGEPYSRNLGGEVRVLRFHLARRQARITYWLAPARRVILLTVFYKTRWADTAQVRRAQRAQELCAAMHGHAESVYERTRPHGRAQ